jgi:hypothetical protein
MTEVALAGNPTSDTPAVLAWRSARMAIEAA